MQPAPPCRHFEQIYHIFVVIRLPQKFVVCCEYCLESAGTKGITEYIVTSDLVIP